MFSSSSEDWRSAHEASFAALPLRKVQFRFRRAEIPLVEVVDILDNTHAQVNPRIVILDSFTLNPGDLSWSGTCSAQSKLEKFTNELRPISVLSRAAGSADRADQ